MKACGQPQNVAWRNGADLPGPRGNEGTQPGIAAGLSGVLPEKGCVVVEGGAEGTAQFLVDGKEAFV